MKHERITDEKLSDIISTMEYMYSQTDNDNGRNLLMAFYELKERREHDYSVPTDPRADETAKRTHASLSQIEYLDSVALDVAKRIAPLRERDLVGGCPQYLAIIQTIVLIALQNVHNDFSFN